LVELDQAVSAGVDPGQLAEQLLGYLRDMMAVSIGGPADLMRTANPNSFDQLRDAGKSWGTMTLLSAMQLLDETIVRMKHSVQSRILLEVALVQICSLVDLQALADVVKGLSQNQVPATGARPAARPPQSLSPPASPSPALNSAQTPTVNSANFSSDDSKKKDNVDTSSPTSANLASAQIAHVDTAIESKGDSAAERTNSVRETNPRAAHTLAEINSVEINPTESNRISEAVASNVALHGNRVAPQSPSPVSSAQARTAQANPLPEPSKAPSAASQAAAQSAAASVMPAAQLRGDRSALDVFREAALRLDGLVQQCGVMALDVIEESATRWRVLLAKEAAFGLQHFRSTENVRRLSETLKETVGQSLGFEFVLTDRGLPQGKSVDGPTAAAVPPAAARPSVPQNQKIREAMTNPLVKRVMELFDGQILRVDEPPALSKTITAPHIAGETTEVGSAEDIAEAT
jgi:DNA polymerase-3 subunit gamma/tau